MTLLKSYKYNVEDCEEVFYLIYKLSTKTTSALIFKLLELVPMLKEVFFLENTNLVCR